MTPDELTRWRKAERRRLLAAREGLDAHALERARLRIDAHLERAFPGLVSTRLAFCWPMHGEYDARPLVQGLRGRGAVTALPVVVAPGRPLEFRAWHPDIALAPGPLGIPYPEASEAIVPTVILVPMIGWDAAGHRLGYGGGYFDRTLATLDPRPTSIGVGYELSRIATIHPQPWDIPMDWVVTERGVYRRDGDALAFLGAPQAGTPGAVASPVCYADEIEPS
ncbi:MAG TPA: 5-formyltetrahydrofolate cyclo-ligase [Methylomirabilota bacterium]|nr:5-formyltetrahydrofolate cyclo-ligase [Methylomirabilota bacterium]